MTGRPGWPTHRPRCRRLDEAVTATETRVDRATWTLRRCAECGEVGLELTATAGGAR